MTKVLSAFLDTVLSKPLFVDADSPMVKRVHRLDVTSDSPLVCVLGDNSSGKSLLRREVQETCEAASYGFFDLSMELRSQDPWIRAETYGDEEVMSTGMISLSAMRRSLSRNHIEPCVLFWDEPDVGLSDEVAAGMGLEILNFLANNTSRGVLGFFLVTHRRSMLEIILEESTRRPPHVLFVSASKKRPKTLTEWLDRKVVPRSSSSVIDEGVERFHAMNEYLNRSKRGRRRGKSSQAASR